LELGEQLNLEQKAAYIIDTLQKLLLIKDKTIEIASIEKFFSDIDKLEKEYQKAAKEYLEKKTDMINEIYEEIKGL